MFEDVISQLYEIRAPLGANTKTPVAGEFALYAAQRAAEMGTDDVDELIGIALLEFQKFNKNDAESLKRFKEILSEELKKISGRIDNWRLADKLKALRGVWLAEAKILKEDRNTKVTVRLTASERRELERRATEEGLTLSEYIRKKLFQ